MTIDVFRAHGLLYVIEFYVQLYIHIYIYVCVSLMGFINQLKTARAPPLYFAGWVEATVEPANQQGLVSRWSRLAGKLHAPTSSSEPYRFHEILLVAILIETMQPSWLAVWVTSQAQKIWMLIPGAFMAGPCRLWGYHFAFLDYYRRYCEVKTEVGSTFMDSWVAFLKAWNPRAFRVSQFWCILWGHAMKPLGMDSSCSCCGWCNWGP